MAVIWLMTCFPIRHRSRAATSMAIVAIMGVLCALLLRASCLDPPDAVGGDSGDGRRYFGAQAPQRRRRGFAESPSIAIRGLLETAYCAAGAVATKALGEASATAAAAG